MKTVSEIFFLSKDYLQKKKVERPRYYTEEILSAVLHIDRMDLYLHFDLPLQEEEIQSIKQFLTRKARGEPIEYIIGNVSFYGCLLEVNQNVLIPRQETEIFMDEIQKELRGWDLRGKKAWDICTGSGCLGLSLKKTFPELEVVLSDLSEQALKVAKKNAQNNSLAVSFQQGDLFCPFHQQMADIIVCNPPYVSQQEFEELSSGVRDFEPSEALLGGPRGTEFYERLAEALPQHLASKGKVFLEIGCSQGERVSQIFSSSLWSKKTLKQDWSGKDRFFFLERE